MKGQYGDDWGKGAIFAIGLIVIFLFVQGAFGSFQIIFPQQEKINALTTQVDSLQKALIERCPACPEVKCVGDMSVPIFIIGMFFGFLGGALFTMHFGKKMLWIFKEKVKEKNKAKK
jgi:hypothetical protein